jgi:hypothetical protein
LNAMTINSHPDYDDQPLMTITKISAAMMPITKIDRHFFHKKMSAGVGGGMMISIVIMLNTTVAASPMFFNKKCLQVVYDVDHSYDGASSLIQNAWRLGLI